MDFAVLDELREAAEAIHFPTMNDARLSAARRGTQRTEQRREFAALMRSIKSLVREDA